MKIAVFHNLPSGGALRTLYDKIRFFEKAGHPVSVYSLGTAERDFLPMPRTSGRQVTEPLDFRGPGRFRRYWQAARRLADEIDASDADAVYVDKCRFLGAPPVLQFLKKPSVFYAHEPLGVWEYNGRLSFLGWFGKLAKLHRLRAHFLKKREDAKSLRAATHVMTNSHFASAWIERVYGRRPTVNYQGVDTALFSPGTEERRLQVLSVGRLEPRKAHDFIARVLARIPMNERPEWVLVYDDEEPASRRALEALCRRSGVAVTLRHRLSEEELVKLYRQSSLVLAPARHEPFGLTPLEAMACGTPVIALNEGGYTETVRDGKTGFLLARDEELWARKLRELLPQKDVLRRLGEEGRRTVERDWAWPAFVRRMEEALKT